MERYYDADRKVYNLLDELISTRFNYLRNTAFKIFIDRKPKIDKLSDKIVFAYIKLPNEVERYLTKEITERGVDYFIFISELVWELASDKDKKRILSHELRHCFIDEKGNYKIIKHDIEDFYEELKLNEDDPMWAQSLGTIAITKYEQLKAEAKHR